jgi:hypothetical protein
VILLELGESVIQQRLDHGGPLPWDWSHGINSVSARESAQGIAGGFSSSPSNPNLPPSLTRTSTGQTQ